MEHKSHKINELDVLNQQFNRQQKKKKKSAVLTKLDPRKNKFALIGFAGFGAAVFIICLLVFFLPRGGSGGIRKIPKGLPEAEVASWKNKPVDPDQFFVNLNTFLTMQEGSKEANLSLMNPPYSAYDFTVEIVLEDADSTPLYSSGMVKPGTYYQTVDFLENFEPGRYEAMLSYTFYGDTPDVIIGEHKVPIDIEVNE